MDGDRRGYLRVRQGAEYAGVSERTFRKWLPSGLRHSVLPSGTILVSYAAIDEWISRFEVTENRVDAIVEQVVNELI
jgi:hypothetical protein